MLRPKTTEELRSDPAVIRNIKNAGGARAQAGARARFENNPVDFAANLGIPTERERTPPPQRPKDKRPFFTHDSNEDIFSELKNAVLKKDAKKYPGDVGRQMQINNMSEKELIDEAEHLKVIKPYEAGYLEDRLSGKSHYANLDDPNHMPSLRDRSPPPVSTPYKRDMEKERDTLETQLKKSASTSTRGVLPGRSAMRSSSAPNERPDIQALENQVNASSRPRSVSTQRARAQGPLQAPDNSLVDQVRSSMNTLQERSASNTSSRPEDEPLNDFANNLGRPAAEARRSVQFPDEAIDPRTGRRTPLRDPVTPVESPFSTTPENDPDDEEEYNTLAASIPEKIKNSRTVDMTNRTFKDTLDLRKLAAEKKLEGYNAHRTYFKNSMYVNPTKLQEEAYDMIGLDDPYSKEKVAEHNELLRTLRPALTKNYASDAAAPFLKRMSENPAKYHKEIMGDVEKDHLDTINNRASREFNEKILPGIRAKYQSPGLLQHGHMDRDIGRASELAARGLHEANSQAALGIRGLTLNAGLQHANMQGQGAAIAGNAAVKDSQSKLGAVKSARETQAEYSARKELQRLKKLEVGSIQRGEKIEKKKMQRDHLLKPEQDEQAHIERLALGMNAIRDPNIRTPADVEQKTPVTTGNNLKALSKAGGAAGRKLIASDFESEDFAKGGIVKGNRLKRASGGSVNSMTEEAIENAITQRTDPLAELRRLFNTDIRKTNPWETKKYYAIGGQVSPIEAGAEAAKEYSLQRAQISRMRQAPKKKPIWLEALDAGMSAAAGPDGGAFGNMASGWNSDLTRENAEKKERESKLTKADELEYKLENDIAERAHKARDMARQEKVADAQIAKYNLQGQKLKADMAAPLPSDLLGPTVTGKQTASDIENTKKADALLTAAKIHHSKIREAEEVVDMPTGVNLAWYIEKFGRNWGTYWYNKMHGKKGETPVTEADLNKFKAKEDELFQSSRNLQTASTSGGGSRFTNMSHLALQAEKFNEGASPDVNIGKLSGEDYKILLTVLDGARLKRMSKVHPDVIARDLAPYGLTLENLKTGIPEHEEYKKTFNKGVQERKAARKPSSTQVVKVDKPVSEMNTQDLIDKRNQALKNKG